LNWYAFVTNDRELWSMLAGSPCARRTISARVPNRSLILSTNRRERPGRHRELRTQEIQRDATVRIVARTETSAATVRYSHGGGTDSPALVLDTSNNELDATYTLPGGVAYNVRGATKQWLYPNLHGDIVASCDDTGTKQGATIAYDPYGNTTTNPDTRTGNFDDGWLGTHQRPLEHAPGLRPTTEMGARQYDPTLGRFLEIDPVEGGVDNPYNDPTDPYRYVDLTGMCRERDICGISCIGITSGTFTFSKFATLVLRFAGYGSYAYWADSFCGLLAREDQIRYHRKRGGNSCYTHMGYLRVKEYLSALQSAIRNGSCLVARFEVDVLHNFDFSKDGLYFHYVEYREILPRYTVAFTLDRPMIIRYLSTTTNCK
jgi:RHS repeat-associated protein